MTVRIKGVDAYLLPCRHLLKKNLTTLVNMRVSDGEGKIEINI